MKNKGMMAALGVLGILLMATTADAQMPGGYPGPGSEQQREGWFCPWCGRGASGPQPGSSYGGSSMMGRGYGMGPGMMHGRGMRHRGWGAGPGPYGPEYDRSHPYGSERYRSERSLSKGRARDLLENYVASTRNPNIKVGDIDEKEDVFEAEIVTREGSLVDRIQVDKQTGWFRSRP